jgi:hypothetical protein
MMLRKKLAFNFTLYLSSCLACAQPNAGGLARTASPAQASVVGSVSDTQTGKPLDDVHVQLIHLPSANSHGIDLVYGAMSKTDGSFSIAGVQAGSYLIGFDLYGFELAPAQKGFDKFLTIHSGEQLNLVVGMVALAVISGEVLDEYGDPLTNMHLLAERLDDTRFTVMRESRQTSTDDRGRFRLLAPPGKYRIKTQFLGGVGSGLPEKRTDGTQPGTYSEVYFPGTPSAAMAAVIEAKAGKESSGVDFRLASSPVLSISGAISNLPANAGCGLSVHWGLTADRMRSGGSAQFLQEPDGRFGGRFLLGNLQPGFYRILAQCNTGTGPLFSQNQLIDLSSATVDGVALRVAPGLLVTGTLMPRSLWQSSAAPRITLQALDSMSTFMSLESDVGPDGSFTIQNVPPGGYRVIVRPLSQNAFIQSVQNNGAGLTNKTVDISETGTNLKVVVSDQGAEISGVVRDSKSAVAPFFGLVFLQPAGEKLKLEGAISSPVDGQGKYNLKAVQPGSYRLIAVGFDTLRSDNSDDLISKLAQSSELLVVQPGDRIIKDLKASSTGEPNAAIQ